MARIAPVRLTYNPRTLWFNAEGLELSPGAKVIVETARGLEFGVVDADVFMSTEETEKTLNTPLKPVLRIATEDDMRRQEEVEELSKLALPIFRRIALETLPDINPVAVEYLFDSDKVVFYFESEERVDFRELVRKLAAEFNVRVDMKQIGVRDSARLVGGLGHCGQEICCRRLGCEFEPVSIRMAKEQDLSLNPQKISGQCGRLMCCLRYENEAYKDFHSRAPKKGARIDTPDGEGRVIELDVPRETVTIKVEEEAPVTVPLSKMEAPSEGARPNAVGELAWAAAQEPVPAAASTLHLFGTSELSRQDKLAEPGSLTYTPLFKDEEKKSRNMRRGGDKEQKKSVAVGRNSSGIRSRGGAGAGEGSGAGGGKSRGKHGDHSGRKPRHRGGAAGNRQSEAAASTSQTAAPSRTPRRRRTHKTSGEE